MRFIRVLAFDPGKRCGWAALESSPDGPLHLGSGVLHIERKENEKYQPYRMRLTQVVAFSTRTLCVTINPQKIITEIIPAQGSIGFMTSGQSYIANVTATTIHNVAYERDIPIEQVSARSWQKQIARRGKSKGITKPQIRNGVLEHIPHLRKELSESLQNWDQWDALGIALFSLGFKTT